MGMTAELLVERLTQDREYLRSFDAVYGMRPTPELAASALAAFEVTLLTGWSAYDRYEWGADRSALTPNARAGLSLFRGKGRCSICHVGANLTDELFHNIGLEIGVDLGRAAVDGAEKRSYTFKTPSLRNVAMTSPYMHDGSKGSLESVVRHYSVGGASGSRLDVEISPLHLSELEIVQLLEFLLSLTGPVVMLHPEYIDELARQN